MSILSIDDRVLGARLGLGDLGASRPCWGYGACCDCEDCRERDKLLALTGSSVERAEPAAQPWESRAA